MWIILLALGFVLILQIQDVVCWTKVGVGKSKTFVSLTTLRDVNSKTHAKQIARVLRNKEKEKQKNRLKTHFGREYNKLKRTHSLPRTPPLTKREIKFARSLPQTSPPAPTNSSDIFSLENDELLPQIKTVLSAALYRKSSFVSAIRVAKLTTVMKFVVIVEGTSKPQLQGLMDGIKVKQDVFIHFISHSNQFYCITRRQCLKNTNFDASKTALLRVAGRCWILVNKCILFLLCDLCV